MLSLIVLTPLFLAIYLTTTGGKISPTYQYSFTAVCLYLAFFVSASYTKLLVFSGFATLGSIHVYNFFIWSQLGGVDIGCSFFFDGVSVLMCSTVLAVAAAVQQFSIYYMATDKSVYRFFQLLSLFSFCMLLLVVSEDLVQLLFGWEAVGLCSYALINFWYTRVQANKAALKAILVNRIGDFALMLGAGLCFVDFGSTNIYDIILTAITQSPVYSSVFTCTYTNLDVLCILFFIAVMSKSAQFGLHTWLPDAMEGPTPVSALIHAATMVTAGVFLMVRLAGLFVLSTSVLDFVCIIGALTAFFGASTATVQTDVKKTIAFSTCSQLGYMVMACGVGHFSAAFFHLLTHAFFKALLFLCAGVLIHTLGGEQDIRKMGGLRKLVPVVYITMTLASLALSGIPYLAGYYSKDLIIGILWSTNTWVSVFAAFSSVVSAFLTSFYSASLLYYVFQTTPRMSKQKSINLHTSPCLYSHFPLLFLTVFTIFGGYFLKDVLIAPDLGTFPGIFAEYVTIPSLAVRAEFSPVWFKFLTLFAALFGFIVYLSASYFGYSSIFVIVLGSHPKLLILYKFLYYRWCVDMIYSFYFVHTYFYISKIWIYLLLQQSVVDLWGVQLWVTFCNNGSYYYLLSHSGGISPKYFLRLFLLSFVLFTIIWYISILYYI